MKFLCLGYLNMDDFDAAPEAVKAEILGKCMPQCVPFRATGKVLVEEGVEHYNKSMVIRPQQEPSKGPLLNSKEQLGSVFIIEAETMEEAIQIASLHPAAMFGADYGFAIEIRPLQQ